MSQNVNKMRFQSQKKKQALKRIENGEKLFTVAAPYSVLCNNVSDCHRNKTELQKFSLKVFHMQAIKNQ